MKRVSQTSNCFIVIPISLLEITRELISRFTDAAFAGDVRKLKEMLDAGVPVDSVYKGGCTALQCAAMYNRTDVTKLLLSRGADVDKQSGDDQSTALHKAALYERTDVIKVLLKHGASKDIKNRNGNTPIDDARGRYNKIAVSLLKQH